MKRQKQRTDSDAWRTGVELAVELLRKSCNGLNAMAISDDSRTGPQHNLVLGYLRKLRRLDDERIEAAFCAVLCDLVASNADPSDGNFFLPFAAKPIATRATTGYAEDRRDKRERMRSEAMAERMRSGNTAH